MSRDLTLTVNIVAPPTTLLGQLAAAMPTRTWVEMDGGTHYGVVCTQPANFYAHWVDPYTVSSIFEWGNRMVWNPYHQTIEHDSAGNHTDQPRFARYRLTDHDCDSAPLNNPYGNHAFDQQTCNPNTGHIYLRSYGDTCNVARWVSGTVPNPASTYTTGPHASNIMAPTEWWTGALTGGGAEGTLVIANCAGTGFVDFYNPLTNTWFASTAVPSWPGSAGGYNNLGAYSAVKNCFVFGGANNSYLNLWKVSSDRSCVKYAQNAPFTMQLGQTNFIADPITGNFVTYTTTRAFYEFNPDGAGTWTQLPEVPANVLMHPGGYGSGWASVTELGIIVVISNATGSLGRMHVYKHGTA